MKQHPIIGACLAAAGFVAAGKAMTKPDDMPFFFGLVFWLMAAGLVLAGAINLYRWAF